MVYITFPAALTEEEEQLKIKYAKLRKKKKVLQAMRTTKVESKPEINPPVKRPSENAEDAMVQAKKLVQSGAIKLDTVRREKLGFKRSNVIEKKMKDTAPGFQPFSATQEESEDRADRHEQSSRPRGKGLYDSFVSSGPRHSRDGRGDDRRDDRRDSRSDDRRDSRSDDRRDSRSDDRRDGRDDRRDRVRDKEFEPPKKGNTIYVNGSGVTESILKKAFSNIGSIVNVSMETDRNCGFVTFDKMESADQAIAEMNKIMIDNVTLHVSMARRQPSFENVADQSAASWTSIAASQSQKGTGHKDKRDMVIYDDNEIF